MKLAGVDGRVLIAWLTLIAGCTEPTYEMGDDAAPSATGDAGGMNDGSTLPEFDAAVGIDVERADSGIDGPSGLDAASGLESDAAGSLDGGAAEDAGPSAASDSATDAGMPPTDTGAPGAVLPAWAKALEGRYIKQSISVGYDSNIGMPVVTSERALVTFIEEANAQLVMQVQTCGFNSQWYDQSIRFALAKPNTLPIIKLKVILGEAPHFTTETVNRAFGFDPARQAKCGGMGQRIEKFSDQVWLSATCTCATYPELPPQTSSDCRLTDPDGDRQPGVLISSTTGVFNFSVAMSTSMKIIDGVVAQDREHTLREQGRANVGCVNTLEDNCTLGTPVECGDVVTDLRPLAADATCATVLAYNLPVGTLPVDKCPKRP